MTIGMVDAGDETDFASFYDVYARSYTRDFDEPYSAREKRMNLESDDYKSTLALLARDDDGQPVGGAFAELPRRDNHTFAYVDVFVVPERRRKGWGTALERTLADACREAGRASMLAEACWAMDDETAPSRAFAQACGYQLDIMDAHRTLALPADLPALVIDAGYEVKGWRGACPDQWIDGYAEVRRLMVQEAPSGESGLENEFWDAERVRREESQWERAGRIPQVSVALTSHGELVGHTQLLFPANSTEVYQWDTLVLRNHRGHGLGQALKVATMRDASDLLEGRRRIHTYNAASNEHMIAVNERLGYRQVAWVGEYVHSTTR